MISQRDRPGWVRGTELIALENEVDALRAKLGAAVEAARCAEQNDRHIEEVLEQFATEALSVQDGALLKTWSWGSLFDELAPYLWDGASTDQIRVALVGVFGSAFNSSAGENETKYLVGRLRSLGLVDLALSGMPLHLRLWKLTDFGKVVSRANSLQPERAHPRRL